MHSGLEFLRKNKTETKKQKKLPSYRIHVSRNTSPGWAKLHRELWHPERAHDLWFGFLPEAHTPLFPKLCIYCGPTQAHAAGELGVLRSCMGVANLSYSAEEHTLLKHASVLRMQRHVSLCVRKTQLAPLMCLIQMMLLRKRKRLFVVKQK